MKQDLKVFILPCTQQVNRCSCWSQLETDRACPTRDSRRLRRVSYLHGKASFDQDWISTGPRHLKRKKPLLSLKSTIASLNFKRALKMPGFENTQDTEGVEKSRCSLLKWHKRICVHKFKENELKCNLQIRNGNYWKCQKEIQPQMKGTKEQTGAVVRWEKNDCIQMRLLIQDPQQSTRPWVWANAPGRSGAGRGQVRYTVMLAF